MGILNILIGPLTQLLGQILPNPQAAADAKLKLLELTQSGALAQLDSDTKQALAAAGIVQAEAQSSGWLTRSWRPLTMLIFVGLICARLFGLTSLHVPDAEYQSLWELVKIGLGGYVIGRSVEKTAPAVVQAFTQSK